jgi:hypothetical protein
MARRRPRRWRNGGGALRALPEHVPTIAGPAEPPDPDVVLDALGAHGPVLEPDPPDSGWLDLRGGTRATPARAAAVLATARAWSFAPASATTHPYLSAPIDKLRYVL